MKHKHGVDRVRVAFGLGVLLLCLGVVANQWLIARLFSSDGRLSPASKRIIGALDFAALATGALVIRNRRRVAEHLKPPRPVDILLLILVSLLSLIMLEWGLRFWLRRYASDRVFGTYATYQMIQERNLRYARHPYLSFFPTPNYRNQHGDRHNALGFRGEEIEVPKPPGRFRIAAIGGSTTYGTGVDNYRKAYPYQLELALKEKGLGSVEVVNAGVGEYDSWPTLVNLLFRVLDLEPDMLVFYEGTNELETRMVYPYEAYRSDNTGRIAPAIVPNTKWIDTFVTTRVLLYPFNIIQSYGDLTKLNDAKSFVADDYYDQLIEARYPSGIFREHDALEILNHNQPFYTERNLHALIALAKAFRITPVYVSFAYAPITRKTSSEVYRQGIAQYNALVQRIANENQIPFFDFGRLMPQDPSYWDRDGVHLNEKGSHLQAELISEHLMLLLAMKAETRMGPSISREVRGNSENGLRR